MKTAKDLMLAYINGSAEQSSALFANTARLSCPTSPRLDCRQS
jgi:hypothetical protein